MLVAVILALAAAGLLFIIVRGMQPEEAPHTSEPLQSTGGHPIESGGDSFAPPEKESAAPKPESSLPETAPPESAPAPSVPSESAPSKAAVGQGDWNLLLVNQSHLLPDFFDITLKKVQNTYRMDERAAPFMEEMLAAARADGVQLLICSGYRSVEKQKELFAAKVQEYRSAGLSEEKAKEKTATMIAVPGTSEHHTGLAADIVTPSYQNLDSGFEDTAAFRWLDAHAYEYGFILRFPKGRQDITGVIYEPWHYRYVGAKHAAIIKERDITLEEYLSES